MTKSVQKCVSTRDIRKGLHSVKILPPLPLCAASVGKSPGQPSSQDIGWVMRRPPRDPILKKIHLVKMFCPAWAQRVQKKSRRPDILTGHRIDVKEG
jgi:hypothetical protein